MIIANILAFFCSLLMVYIGAVRSKKTAIKLTIIQIAGMGVCSIIAGSWSAVAVGVVGIVRNLCSYYDKMNKKTTTIIAAATIVLGLMFNSMGFIGLLPIAANLLYLYSLDGTDIYKFKYNCILVNSCWAIHDFSIGLYTAVIFDVMSLLTMGYSIFLLKRDGVKSHKVVESY